MKKKYVIIPIVALLGYCSLTSYQAGPGLSSLERTGASGGTTGCSGGGCHGSSAGITVSVELLSGTTPVTTYTAGASYTVRVTGTYSSSSTSAASLPKFGYQLSAMRTGSTTANAGTWGTPPAGSHAATAVGVNLVEQSSGITATTGGGAPGSTYVINMPWTAPAAGTGSVTLRSVINAVNGTGGADATDRWASGSAPITEAASSPGPISGTLSVCAGSTTTLTNATAGGTWTSGSTSVATVGASTGIVTGVTAGTAVITYSTGGGTPATATVTVNPTPTAITGTTTVCIGATTTLTSTPTGGTWTSATTAVATFVSPGVLSGIAAGTSIVTYALGTCSVTTTATVVATGAGTISGSHTVCVGTTTTLTSSTTGGTWTSSNTTRATVGATTGIVTGVAVGIANISYSATNVCGTSVSVHSVNVLAASACPTGILPVSDIGDELRVGPNPNSGTFSIEMVQPVSEFVRVTVTNIAGQIVREQYVPANEVRTIDMQHVPGVYQVTATSSRGRYVSRILVQ